MTAQEPINYAWFSQKLLDWHQLHGRKNLPWQKNPTPYRVWISEIMLQQTQVATVIPYYERFMQRFPDYRSLASASMDDVLNLWAGLGYYARGRNVHRTAQLVIKEHDGELPVDIDQLQKLPGLGRSTAAAILSLAHHQCQAILDGNVKRVLTRFHAIEGWPGQRNVLKTLWSLAEKHTPKKNTARYTQAIMDLGATLCTRSSPLCQQCPVNTDCTAYKNDTVTQYPASKPKKKLPTRKTIMLMLVNRDNAVLVIKRPPTGIWGGLWALPECSEQNTLKDWCRNTLHIKIGDYEIHPGWRHSFTHYHLDITPVLARISGDTSCVMDDSQHLWYNATKNYAIGLATPTAKLLKQYFFKEITNDTYGALRKIKSRN
ncbi:MAG: A/G-specific adenine glycosylase [Gammaproteobacteria bacterium]